MMKKSLSLILVLALALGFTAFATPLTKVYIAQDFENYNSVDELISTFDKFDITAGTHTAMLAGSVLNIINDLKQDDSQMAKNSVISAAAAANKAPITSSNSAIELNSFGKKTLRTTLPTMKSKQHGGLLFIPAESWDFTNSDNQNQIYVVSYDVEMNLKDSSEELYYLNSVYFTDEAKSSIFDLNLTWIKPGGAHGAVTGDKHGSSSTIENALVNGVAERLTFAYTFGEGKTYNDAENNPYNVPTRYFYKDGEKWHSTRYKSTDNFGTAHGWKGKPFISGFRLGFSSSFDLEFADILAYTIENLPSEFKVEILDNDIDRGEKVVLKFNAPIFCNSLVKEAFSITENEQPFTLFEIGKIKNLVDNGEVYTTAELEFPFGLKADSTYNITFNTTGTAVRSELGWLLPENNNSVSFTTPQRSVTDSIEFAAKSGLVGDADDLLAIGSEPTQAKFTAKATSMDKASFLFIGIYDSYNNLVSYTYTKATTGDILSLASRVENGYKVKAFSCSSIYDLTQLFSTESIIQ